MYRFIYFSIYLILLMYKYSMWIWAAQAQKKYYVCKRCGTNHLHYTLVKQHQEATKMCLNQHGVRPRSMDITRQRHRLQLHQRQSKVMRPVSSQNRLPESFMGVTGHPKTPGSPNGDHCNGMHADVAFIRCPHDSICVSIHMICTG